jgi:hypothetical protein
MPDVNLEPYELYEESETEVANDQTASDMETEVEDETLEPHSSGIFIEQSKEQLLPPPSEVPSSAYFTARSEVYHSIASNFGISNTQRER